MKNEEQINIEELEKVQFVIIDCSTFIYLDLPALEMFKTVNIKIIKV